jgi:hypothetical protein
LGLLVFPRFLPKSLGYLQKLSNSLTTIAPNATDPKRQRGAFGSTILMGELPKD